MTLRRVRALALVPPLLALAAPARADSPQAKPTSPKASPAVSREGIESLEAQLDRAADRVSVPHPAMLLGRPGATRGYRLPGYGVVFVLAPRSLPGGAGAVYVFRHGPPKPRHFGAETRPRIVGDEQAQKEAQDIEVLERQVLVFQQEAEEARRAAEEDMDRIVHNVRERLAPPPHEAPAPTPPPAEVGRISPPAAPLPPAPSSAPLPPVAAVPAAPPALELQAPAVGPMPVPPPWKFWFEAGRPEDTREPERVVADVRGALIEALESQSSHLGGLGAEEFVTVAVDFVPGGLFASRARPAKTLVVRARVKDLQARTKGALAPAELRRRVEVFEY